jgi:hypothetical protein
MAFSIKQPGAGVRATATGPALERRGQLYEGVGPAPCKHKDRQHGHNLLTTARRPNLHH